MNKIRISLQHCYGIREFDKEFDFNNGNKNNTPNVKAIYASNGSMKTSFAQTLRDISNQTKPQDRIFQERSTTCTIQDENEHKIPSEQILSIAPYEESFTPQNQSILIADQKLKERYQQCIQNIEHGIDSVFEELAGLNTLPTKKNTVRDRFKKGFNIEEDNSFHIIDQLNKLADEVDDTETEMDVRLLDYDVLASDNIKKIVEDSNFQNYINEYLRLLNQLIEKSEIFTHNNFNHQQADKLEQELGQLGFFEASHSINLSDSVGNTQTITSREEYKQVLQQEKERIYSDSQVQRQFEKIDALLNKNQEARRLRDIIRNNKELIRDLTDFDHLQRKLWILYLQQVQSTYLSCLERYKNTYDAINKIRKEAQQSYTQWEQIVDDFNTRFSVPFTLSLKQQEDTILAGEPPTVSFIYRDNYTDEERGLSLEDLRTSLSGGEKRALYLLNVMFQISIAEHMNEQTLLIIDDIADSFDYKNKYAILEYLYDLSQKTSSGTEAKIFHMIVLSHNYDFHRTFTSRVQPGPFNSYIAKSKDGCISLEEDKFQKKTPFWVFYKKCEKDKRYLLACIPFIRNLAEYTNHKYTKSGLTQLLHYKEATQQLKHTHDLTIEDLKDFINTFMTHNQVTLSNYQKHKKVLDLIFEEAENINSDSIQFEDKLILAMAIRLQVEMFIKKRTGFSDSTSNQTKDFIKSFKLGKHGTDQEEKTLKRVELMTPENIHINSFMYEPLIDMSASELKELYDEVKGLTPYVEKH